jgi:hypothetical protein
MLTQAPRDLSGKWDLVECSSPNLLDVRQLLALAAIAVLAGCNSPGPAAIGPSDVAVQSSDVPKGVQRCDGSGDIDSFLNTIKAKDPTSYQSTKDEWDKAKADGATAAVVVFYADTTAHCNDVASSQNSNLAGAAYPLVINFVVQFKDEKSAEQGYTTESIFGFSESSLSSSGITNVVKGTQTGLSKNAISLTLAIGNQSFYVAVWQNKAFMVILAVINVDTAQSKKIATNENSRIK